MKKNNTHNNYLKQIQDMARDYENKSEKEMHMEITRINEEIEKEMSYEEHEELFKKLKAIRLLLDDA